MKYRNWVDTAYPERYEAAARQETVAAFASQVNNGQVLNQTVWNWYFEQEKVTDKVTGKESLKPSAKLNGAGRAKLDSIAQTRPNPDSRIYLQVARDVPVVGDKVDEARAERDALTVKRADAVRSYLNSMPTVNQTAYDLFVHDPVVPGIPAEFSASALRGQRAGYVGGLSAGGGTAALSTGSGGLLQPAQPTTSTTNSTSTNTNINGGTTPAGTGPNP
jgi:hypothetical protein